MTRLELLQQLSDAVGVSGDETEVRKLIRGQIEGLATDIHVDVLGNLHATKKGTGASALKVVVSAAMDETGFMVVEIGDGGLISAQPVGSHDLRYLATKRLLVGKKKQPGHFLWVPIHKSTGQNTLVKVADMPIDVGAASKGEVQAQPGDRIAYAAAFRAMRETVVQGKALESRAACVALIELLQGDPFPFDLSAVFTAQAQLGARGMVAASAALTPDAALSFFGVLATDLPANLDRSDKTAVVRMGGGPVLRVNEPGYIADPAMIAHLRAVAAEQGIPVQLHSQTGAPATDAGRLGAGPKASHAANLSLPIRYLGTPAGLLDLNDLEAMINLARAALHALPHAALENES